MLQKHNKLLMSRDQLCKLPLSTSSTRHVILTAPKTKDPFHAMRALVSTQPSFLRPEVTTMVRRGLQLRGPWEWGVVGLSFFSLEITSRELGLLWAREKSLKIRPAQLRLFCRSATTGSDCPQVPKASPSGAGGMKHLDSIDSGRKCER
jgi:hypothetical protein